MKKITYTFLLILISFSAFSQKASEIEIQTVLKNFLIQEKQNLTKQNYEQISILSEDKKETVAYVFNYTNSFVVISARKEFTPVKAFSFDTKFSSVKNKNNPTLLNMLVLDYKLMNENINFSKEKNNSKWSNLLSGNVKSTPATLVNPLLTSVYGQAYCEDQNGSSINVTNLYTPNNWSVGCVALSLATVMQYFEWPVHGIGSYSYSDGGSSQTVSANFEDTYYQWNTILDEYYNLSTTTTEREALGELAFQAAVPLAMYFTSTGSSSDVNKVSRAGIQHFRYTAHHESKSNPKFWDLVKGNLTNSLPVQFSIYTSSGAGHAIVCDGVSEDNYYHLNMGWWGTSNAWYEVERNFNAGGYSIITGGVFDMLPVPELEKPNTFIDQNKAEITWLYPESIENPVFELQVKRDDFDWITLSNTITDKFYTINTNDYSTYKYRVRAQYKGEWTIESWSEEKDLHKVLTSIKNKNFSQNVKIYPQPARDELSIELNFPNTNKEISLLSLNGSVIFSTLVEGNENKLNLNTSAWDRGVYLLKIQTNEALITKKIILQ